MKLRTALAILLLAGLPGLAAASLQCAESDRMGNRSVASIKTDKAGTVQSFHWEMKARNGDRCEFDSADFLRVPRAAASEFKSARGCRLFIWSQGNGVTLAHNTCEAHCTGTEAHDYLWPIIFDKNGRGCGRPK